MRLEALDALVDALDTSGLSLLLVRCIGTTMREVVVVANAHLLCIDSAESLQTLGNHDTISAFALALAVPLASRFPRWAFLRSCLLVLGIRLGP